MSDGLVVAVLALSGVLVAQSVVVWVCLRTTGLARAQALDAATRWGREQRLDLLRWAADVATQDRGRRSRTGLAVLDAMGRLDMDPADQPVLDAVLDVLTSNVTFLYTGRDDKEQR